MQLQLSCIDSKKQLCYNPLFRGMQAPSSFIKPVAFLLLACLMLWACCCLAFYMCVSFIVCVSVSVCSPIAPNLCCRSLLPMILQRPQPDCPRHGICLPNLPQLPRSTSLQQHGQPCCYGGCYHAPQPHKCCCSCDCGWEGGQRLGGHGGEGGFAHAIK